MCLTRVNGVYDGISTMVWQGFKVFASFSGLDGEINLFSAFSPFGRRLAMDEWLDERDYRPYKDKDYIDAVVRYPVGWHILLVKADAEELAKWLNHDSCNVRYTVWEVKCKGRLAAGYEDDAPVEVYKYIKIENEV